MEGALLQGIMQGVQGEAQVLSMSRDERAGQGDRRDTHPRPAGARVQHHRDLRDAASRIQRPELGCWLSSGRLCLRIPAESDRRAKFMFSCATWEICGPQGGEGSDSVYVRSGWPMNPGSINSHARERHACDEYSAPVTQHAVQRGSALSFKARTRTSCQGDANRHAMHHVLLAPLRPGVMQGAAA